MTRLPAVERNRLRALEREKRDLLRPHKLAKAKARKADSRARTVRIGKTSPGQRQRREREPAFLAYLRQQPCEAAGLGGCAGPIEAAHVRYSDASKGSVNPGLQRKNHDRHANPLCQHHHQHDQHKRAERAFWASLDKDAYDTAAGHYAAYRGGHK